MSPLTGIAPSILAADFARLGEQVDAVLAAGARVIHVDVMDGHFVPQIVMGATVVSALRERIHGAGALIDVHLMVERPERHVADFAKAGADSITIHVEATPHLHYTLGAIHELGCTAGLAVNPGTPVESITELLDEADLILCMTVNPGWGGQAFLPSSTGKLERFRALIGPDLPLEVDGGIDAPTAAACAGAGASLFVAGSSVFGAEDPATQVKALQEAIVGVRPPV